MADDAATTPLLPRSSSRRDSEEEPTGCGASLACDPRRGLHRYLVLIPICLLNFGSYFCYDNPAALQSQMLKDLDLDTAHFMQFYSWYSWPNVILCFFGGVLIDRVFGIRLGAIIFAGFVFLGQVVFALGAYLNLFWLMDVGRFIFGIGGESLAVAQNTYTVSWFKGRELNMVFGLQLSMARIGSTVNMNTMQPLYNAIHQYFSGYKCTGISLFIASSTCLFSLLCAIWLGYFDKRAKRILKQDDVKAGDAPKLKDFITLLRSVPLWIVCIICVAYYVSVFPFIDLGLVFFQMKFNLPNSKASICNSLVYILSAAASPVFGFLIDKLGKNLFWVMAGIILTLGCHALMAFTFFTPFVGMVIMGLAYSVLASALWPLVALIIPENQLGTAYGLMQSLQNLGLAVIALVAGTIVDSKGYLVLEVFFLVWLCVAFVAAACLYLYNAAKGGSLNLTAWQRNKKAEQKS